MVLVLTNKCIVQRLALTILARKKTMNPLLVNASSLEVKRCMESPHKLYAPDTKNKKKEGVSEGELNGIFQVRRIRFLRQTELSPMQV